MPLHGSLFDPFLCMTQQILWATLHVNEAIYKANRLAIRFMAQTEKKHAPE